MDVLLVKEIRVHDNDNAPMPAENLKPILFDGVISSEGAEELKRLIDEAEDCAAQAEQS